MPEAKSVKISNGRLSATVNSLGAELSSFRDHGGRELMGAIKSQVGEAADGSPVFWTGHAPLLFPIVGAPFDNTIRVNGQLYPMNLHGFALGRVFSIVAEEPTVAVFALTDDDKTRAIYPFQFRLEIRFSISGDTLITEAVIQNLSAVALPASFGFHPAFAWPLPYGAKREDHRIIFAAEESDEIRQIAADGTIQPQPRPTPLAGRELRLRDELFEADALVWDDIRSDRVTYGAESGPKLQIAFPDAPMLGIWTRPGESFVCVEPWHGIADPEGFSGDITEKPGIFQIPVGGEKRVAMSVTLMI